MEVEAIRIMIDGIKDDLGEEQTTPLFEAGVEAEVYAVLCELRLAGDVKPNLSKAISIAGVGPQLAKWYRENTDVYLDANDVREATIHVLYAAPQIIGKRHALRLGIPYDTTRSYGYRETQRVKREKRAS
jgi:hypothetical protein